MGFFSCSFWPNGTEALLANRTALRRFQNHVGLAPRLIARTAGTLVFAVSCAAVAFALSAPRLAQLLAPAPIVGAMDGDTCVPRGNGEILWPGEDLCVTFPQQIGHWTFSISPAAPAEPVPPMNNNPDTIQLQFNRLSGTAYTVALPIVVVNGVDEGGQFSFTIKTPTAAQQKAAQAHPVRHVSAYFGTLVHDATAPFGILDSLDPPYPIDRQKLAVLISQGVQIARTEISPFFVNPAPGVYNFSKFDPVIDALEDHGIKSYIEIRASPVQGWANSHSERTSPMYAKPADYAKFCAAVAMHLTMKYPSIKKVAIADNEPNFSYNWRDEMGAELSGDAAYRDYTGAGEALYLKPCYAAIKAVAPTLQVFAPEVGFGGSIDAIPFLENLYTNGCRVGVCFDGLSMHLSPYNNMIYSTRQCFYHGAGWTGRCYKDMQAVCVAHGDPKPPVILSETGYSTAPITQGFDEAGQAYLMSKEFALLEADPTVVGVYWSYIDSPAATSGTYFGEVRTVHNDYSPKASFAVYRAFATR
jgi:hypothetical protein